ncbi:sugar ABC transporter ATP-binding protein [uncultured Sphaerochaeta sp.]|uniref:sugar ABC transporter ATP-binding protein n=1 Tax=uncultured Sphaerochaeta sp. TaxID=886478 RepID=UPI002A0A2502|nr:sugar ABC transporter ATP-binding protein [uncultured Sphaerochaeta sp.]
MVQDFLKIHHVYKTFDAVKALVDVNLCIKQGEIHCIVGENGCGKSTLMKIISGVLSYDPLDESYLEICGHRMENYTPAMAMHEGIQVIYQDLALFPNLTIAENILTNDRIANRTPFINYRKMYNQAGKALAEVQLEVDSHQFVNSLSIAQQQLVAISRAITNNVKLLIMDEPTASLGKSDVDHLIQIILALKKRGVSVIFIGHKLDEVIKIADSITIIRDGHIIEQIDDIATVSEHDIIHLMTGKEEAEYESYTPIIDKTQQPVLELIDFNKKGLFRNINLELFRGEILGIIGLVGAGRTELFSTVFGLENPDSGSIFIDRKLVSINTVQDAIQQGIALVPENRLTEGLFTKKTIKENINVTTLDDHISSIGLLKTDELEKNSQSWVTTLKIKTENHNNITTSLSGGNQQRIVLAKWLATNPHILILDGPTIGIDIGAKAEIHQFIRQLVKDKNIAVIMITDEISEVMKNSSRILVMRDGEFVLNSDRKDVDENKIRHALGIA